MKDQAETRKRRRQMVEGQLASRGIGDRRVLDAMSQVPREEFVAPGMVEFAYEDTPLPIEAEQTISQPYIVALMLEALSPRPGDRALEVGAGSGYAAAVLSRLVSQVFAVERHGVLARAAQQRMDMLDYDNVEVRHGDGTLGWEDEAPFDVILVSAGGQEVPRALKAQLAPGGRLVIPVGEVRSHQELLLFTKAEDGTLERRNLGPVRFVPLIGTVAPDTGSQEPSSRKAPSAVDLVRSHAEPFPAVDEADLDGAVDRMAGHATVLLGEASHGTSEFYALRARLTRRLIEEGEIDFVAVEADWPDAAHLDRYVRGVDEGPPRMAPFVRFPRWMWANRETLEFLQWLREFNQDIQEPKDRVGFFGLDLYSLHTSVDAVLAYLDDVDPETAAVARDRYGCLSPWERDPQLYGRLVTSGRLEACADDVVAMLKDLLEKRLDYEPADGLRYLNAVQNARLVANAEDYYRAMYRGPTASWNLRDQHMFDTLDDLLAFHGDDAAAAVWAHNSHLGDASATEMGADGQHNVGQLCRRRFGDRCYAVGFGTHTGTVMAADNWGDPGRVMDVNPSLSGSYERLSHDAEVERFFLPLRESDELRRALAPERLQRAIGVIYRPETERMSHYFHASLPRQFDEWIFLDRTRAVTPLVPSSATEEVEDVYDTYPFAV